MTITNDDERACRESQAGVEYEGQEKPMYRINWILIVAIIANFALIIWGIVWLVSSAKADDCRPETCSKLMDFDNRIHDLEINMQAQIAKPCACAAPTAAAEISENEAGAFSRCLSKIKRFVGTEATDESRARFLWHCGYQAGVWKRRDP